MGGYNSGGHNRTHGRLESYRRIDSFSFRTFLDWFDVIACDGIVTQPILGGDITYDLKDDTATITYNGQSVPLYISKVPNIDGVSYRLYFHCPACGERVRYLYRRFGYYICRKCAKLNYRSQQVNGLEELRLKMQRIVEKDLCYLDWEIDHPGIPIQDLLYIPRPRYMRQSKYERLMQEYRHLQDEHERGFFKGLLQCRLIPDEMRARVQAHIDSI